MEYHKDTPYIVFMQHLFLIEKKLSKLIFILILTKSNFILADNFDCSRLQLKEFSDSYIPKTQREIESIKDQYYFGAVDQIDTCSQDDLSESTSSGSNDSGAGGSDNSGDQNSSGDGLEKSSSEGESSENSLSESENLDENNSASDGFGNESFQGDISENNNYKKYLLDQENLFSSKFSNPNQDAVNSIASSEFGNSGLKNYPSDSNSSDEDNSSKEASSLSNGADHEELSASDNISILKRQLRERMKNEKDPEKKKEIKSLIDSL